MRVVGVGAIVSMVFVAPRVGRFPADETFSASEICDVSTSIGSCRGRWVATARLGGADALAAVAGLAPPIFVRFGRGMVALEDRFRSHYHKAE